MWVRAMHSYYLVCKVVAPKRAMLADANAQLEEVMIELNTARAKLAEVRFPCIHLFIKKFCDIHMGCRSLVVLSHQRHTKNILQRYWGHVVGLRFTAIDSVYSVEKLICAS